MFAGTLRFAGAAPDAAAWRSALAPHHQPDRGGVWSSGSLALVEHRLFNGPATRDEQVPLRCPETGVALAFWGRLDNRPALARRLAVEDRALAAATDAELVLAAWRRWGEDLPEHLLGDFALAVADTDRERVFLARDPLGVKPLYYCLDERLLAFATSVPALRGIDGVSLTPDADWIARYVLDLAADVRRTGFRDVVKLPPGHCLTVDRDGSQRLRAWHAWRDDPPPAARRDPRWVHEYRTVLEEAVRCRMAADLPLATENSGGLDSATITAYLARFLGEPGERLHTFGFAYHKEEPDLILATSQAHRILHNYVITGRQSAESTERDMTRALRVVGYPEVHGNAVGHIPFYRECELRGIRALFSGFGGDQVTTSPGGHLRWELLDAGHYAALWGVLPGGTLRRTLRTGKAALVGREGPACNAALLEGCKRRWPAQLLRAEVVRRLDLRTEYFERARFGASYRRINDFILQRLLPLPGIHSRLESCTLLAASYGVDYRWPLWDVRLVQQYLSTPSIEKVGPHGMGRYLHRRAVDGVVPSRITWRPGKDVGPLVTPPDEGSALRRAVAQARRLETDLHPAIAEVIDGAKLRAQIERAERGADDGTFSRNFRGNVRMLTQLQAWLEGEPAG